MDQTAPDDSIEEMDVVVAILAKDKAHALPSFLNCILKQDYPKKLIHLYIRTNDNNDSTELILKDFVDANRDSYASVYFDASDIDASLKTFGQHEWNYQRFKILSAIRQDSIRYAKERCADYFVVDCDNLIAPYALSSMVSLRSLGVISPMLESNSLYSNYHFSVDENGYFRSCEQYPTIRHRKIKGLHEVGVVHCTYYISSSLLTDVCYDDESARYEYVIFSDCLRRKKIAQYLDNRKFYGFISFAETYDEFMKDYSRFNDLSA